MVSAEIKAIRYGLILASNIGCSNIIIESDSLNALEVVSDLDAYMGPDVPIITETRLLAINFSNVSFVHCGSETTLVVDCLAKHYFSLDLSPFWDSNPPDSILPYIVNDMAII